MFHVYRCSANRPYLYLQASVSIGSKEFSVPPPQKKEIFRTVENIDVEGGGDRTTRYGSETRSILQPCPSNRDSRGYFLLARPVYCVHHSECTKLQYLFRKIHLDRHWEEYPTSCPVVVSRFRPLSTPPPTPGLNIFLRI